MQSKGARVIKLGSGEAEFSFYPFPWTSHVHNVSAFPVMAVRVMKVSEKSKISENVVPVSMATGHMMFKI